MSTPSVIVGTPVIIASLPVAETPDDDDFLILEGVTNGTRRFGARYWRDLINDFQVTLGSHEARIAALEAAGTATVAERVAALETQLAAAVQRLAESESVIQRLKDIG